MVEEALKLVCDGQNLDLSAAENLARALLEEEVNPVKISALLAGLRTKGETAEEIAGFVKVLREKSIKIDIDDPHLVDLAGTGGDGRSSFNISTIASFVVAAAGAKVAKHGNRAISGVCGSTDLIEALGVKVPDDPEKVKASIREVGIGFIHAPYFHPEMKKVQPIRRELGIKTIFNLLGPMINPAGVKRQLIGFFSRKAMEVSARVISFMGGQRYLLVHSEDGLDEISAQAPTSAILVEKNEIREISIHPEDFGMKPGGGDIKIKSLLDSLKIIFSVLQGEKSIYRDYVLLNAGAAIFVSGLAADMKEGVARASEAIDSGEAFRRLIAFMKFNGGKDEFPADD